MNPSFRKLLLTAHVTTSVATIGAVTGFLALALVGLRGGEQQAAASAYEAMEVIAWTAILPLIIASLLTGLVQSLGSEWGLFRHYWIVVKLAINILATALLLLHMRPIGVLARAAENHALIEGGLSKLQVQLVANAIAAIVVLLLATALSVYKPRGLTPYGLRLSNGNGAERAAPAWARYLGFLVLGLVAGIVALHLAGIGFGPH
jgi:hypothetical protein